MKKSKQTGWGVSAILVVSSLCYSIGPESKTNDARLVNLPALIEKQMTD